MRLAICLRYFPRSLISSAAQAGCAFSAAATALFTSAASPAGNSPIFSSVAGLTELDPLVGLAGDHLAADQHLAFHLGVHVHVSAPPGLPTALGVGELGQLLFDDRISTGE